MSEPFVQLYNGQSLEAACCPILSMESFRESVFQQVESGGRLAALFAQPDETSLRLFAVVARAASGDLTATSTRLDRQYPALTPDCPQAHWFEREIAEQWEVHPEGHPWLKPIRFQPPRSGRRVGGRIGQTDFFRMNGRHVHEVAVGPVHAGIIEPGHFRFQCHGETVYHLEISLGYQHRGVERALAGGPDRRTIHWIETMAGDTTISHTQAYCRAIESLADVRVTPRAQVIRGLAAELERVANHVGDLGAMAGDVGYLPTMSFCGRIRGDVLNVTAMICGNRFGRSLLRPGGVAFDLDPPLVRQMLDRIDTIRRDVRVAVDLLWETPSVMARFDGAGTITAELCHEVGLVGVPARACGLEQDTRSDFPYGLYRFAQIPVSTWATGDVFARAYVRWLEIQRSLAFIREQLDSLPDGPIQVPAEPLGPRRLVVALTEGWRGAICHVAQTDGQGKLAWYKVVDPSFHNWFGLSYALRGQQISDFPLCNKSFNLSYCGHDL